MGGVISFDAGDYLIRCRVGGDQIGDEPIRVMVRVGGEDIEEFEVSASKDRPTTLKTKVRMKAGTSRVTVALLNPYSLPAEEDEKKDDAPEAKPEERPRDDGGGRRSQPPPPVRERPKRLCRHSLQHR